MAVIVNNEDGLAVNMDDAAANAAIESGTHGVPLAKPDGSIESFSKMDAARALNAKTHVAPDQTQLSHMMRTAKFNSTGEQIKTVLEGAAEGVAGPLAPLAEKAFGVKAEDMLGREETNPILHGASQVAGLVGSSMLDLGLGAALNTAGKAARAAAGLEKGATLFGSKAAATIAGHAAAGGVENAIFQATDEVSNVLKGNPADDIGHALAHVGIAGLIGVGVGGALGTVPAAMDAMSEGPIGRWAADFKGRLKQHIEVPDQLGALTREVQEFHGPLQEQALKDVYGAGGLRQQELEKLLPTEISPKLRDANVQMVNKIGDDLGVMQKNAANYPAHNVNELQRQYTNLLSKVNDVDAKAIDVHNAFNEFKQYAQGTYDAMKRTNKFELPYKFLETVNSLGKDVRASLESPVWGAAGERNAAINKAWSQFQQPLKDFNSKFTTKIDNVRKIDPAKVQTYFNQLGNAKAEIKQEVMTKFLDASDKFRTAMDATHGNLGISNPLTDASSAMMRSSTGTITPGAAAADALIAHGAGQAAGSAIGGTIGGTFGHPMMGAVAGSKLLGGPLDKAFKKLVMPMLNGAETSGKGVIAAMNFTAAAIKGESKLNAVTEDIFKAGNAVITSDANKRDQIKKRLEHLQENPSKLTDGNDAMQNLLPEHAAQIAQSKVQIGQYLQSLKPNTEPLGPLDAKQKPSAEAVSRYNNALDIAANPLIVAQKLKNGTITVNDIKDLQAIAPALADNMRRKIMEHLVTAKHNNVIIPYKVQQSLSMFMAQPLSASMQPMAIMANQGMPPQPQMPGGQPGSAPTRHNYTGIQKLPSSYETPQQSRAASRSHR